MKSELHCIIIQRLKDLGSNHVPKGSANLDGGRLPCLSPDLFISEKGWLLKGCWWSSKKPLRIGSRHACSFVSASFQRGGVDKKLANGFGQPPNRQEMRGNNYHDLCAWRMSYCGESDVEKNNQWYGIHLIFTKPNNVKMIPLAWLRNGLITCWNHRI